jgi:hypothetical protein
LHTGTGAIGLLLLAAVNEYSSYLLDFEYRLHTAVLLIIAAPSNISFPTNNIPQAGLSFLIPSIYALVLTCDWMGSDLA